MNDYDVQYIMDKYYFKSDKDRYYHDEMHLLEHVLKHTAKVQRDPDEDLIRENNYLNEKVSDLVDRVRDLKAQLEASKNEKKVAQRRLKLFIKAASSLKLVDKLKVEIVKLVEYEKTNIKFNRFFGITTNHLEQYENELESFEEIEK